MKENKYQEALDYIIDCIEFNYKTIKDLEAIEFYCDMVQEVVDKENQMKPIEGKGFTVHDCPTCDDGYIEVDGYYKLNRCVNCGQKIDWSIENE